MPSNERREWPAYDVLRKQAAGDFNDMTPCPVCECPSAVHMVDVGGAPGLICPPPGTDPQKMREMVARAPKVPVLREEGRRRGAEEGRRRGAEEGRRRGAEEGRPGPPSARRLDEALVEPERRIAAFLAELEMVQPDLRKYAERAMELMSDPTRYEDVMVLARALDDVARDSQIARNRLDAAMALNDTLFRKPSIDAGFRPRLPSLEPSRTQPEPVAPRRPRRRYQEE